MNNDNLFVPGDDAGDEDEEEAADLLHVTVEGTSPPKKHGDAPLVAIGDVHAFFNLSRLAHLTLLAASLWPLPGQKPPTMSLPEEGPRYNSLLGVSK